MKQTPESFVGEDERQRTDKTAAVRPSLIADGLSAQRTEGSPNEEILIIRYPERRSPVTMRSRCVPLCAFARISAHPQPFPSNSSEMAQIVGAAQHIASGKERGLIHLRRIDAPDKALAR